MVFLRKHLPRFFVGISLLACLILFQNCSKTDESEANNPESPNGNAAAAKGLREIGIDILDTTPSSSFNNNIALAKAAGSSFMILGLGWNQIESSTPSDCASAGTYVDPGNALATFNSLLPASGMKLSLSILPVSTNLNLMPSNLTNADFDDPLVICRFQKMLTFVFSKIPNIELVSLQFGNEIDAYPAATQLSFWSQYWGLFTQASLSAKSLRPGVKTSIVSTLHGSTGQSSNPLAQGGLQQIYNSADVVVVTYYPLNPNFTVKSPDIVVSEVGALVSHYPSKPIYFNEIGYQSGSTYDASSEALQKEFIINVFKAWDKYPNQILKMSFLRLNDVSPSAAQSTANTYGLPGNNQFIEYIQTLGLRTYDGHDKQAYIQLKIEAASRGW